MPSLRARFVNAYLRMTVRRLPMPRMESQAIRDWFEKRALPLLPRGVVREDVAAPVKGEWLRPAQARPSRAILYFHGGGYVFGSARMYRTLTYRLALDAEAEVFAPDYRLAHEHPCPAAIEDALAAYEWMLSQKRRPEHIAVGGDSAGGGLTLALLQALRQKGAPMPACAFLYSPWTDLALTGASIARNAHSDATFKAETVRNAPGRYLGTLDPKDPRASPLYGDFSGLPPLLFFAGTSEMLYDDAVRAAEKAKASGVQTETVLGEGLPHIWPMYHALMPEGKEGVRRTAEFIRERMKSG